jgi:hypothetical protein
MDFDVLPFLTEGVGASPSTLFFVHAGPDRFLFPDRGRIHETSLYEVLIHAGARYLYRL